MVASAECRASLNLWSVAHLPLPCLRRCYRRREGEVGVKRYDGSVLLACSGHRTIVKRRYKTRILEVAIQFADQSSLSCVIRPLHPSGFEESGMRGRVRVW